jgi:hypothetical protein
LLALRRQERRRAFDERRKIHRQYLISGYSPDRYYRASAALGGFNHSAVLY